MIRKPSDLGYADGDFILPELSVNQVTVEVEHADMGMLFSMEARTMQERRDARRASIKERVAVVADMANGSTDPWIVWCDLNAESDALVRAIPDAKDVRGSHTPEEKRDRMMAFSDGTLRVLVTKPSIAGFGMNWQHCANMAFTGLSDSYEQFYQGVRRCWRFGQERDVQCYVVTSSAEGAVVANIVRKEHDAEQMAASMIEHMHDISSETIRGTTRESTEYKPQEEMRLPAFI